MLLLLDARRLLVLDLLHEHLPLRLQVPRPLPLSVDLQSQCLLDLTLYNVCRFFLLKSSSWALNKLGSKSVNFHLECIYSLPVFQLCRHGYILGFSKLFLVLTHLQFCFLKLNLELLVLSSKFLIDSVSLSEPFLKVCNMLIKLFDLRLRCYVQCRC